MLGDPPPMNSGRERAIETLIDTEPNGPFYRASRLLDEAVPFALSNRSNLVTRSALVEQAFALATNEIDSVEKYLEGQTTLQRPSVEQKDPPDDDFKERVLRHHAKIEAAKHGAALSGSPVPPPQLVTALRKIYGSTDDEMDAVGSSILPSLLRDVVAHKVFSGGEIGSAENEAEGNGNEGTDSVSSSVSVCNLEAIVRNVCVGLDGGDEGVQGILIAILSILCGTILENGQEEESLELSEGKAKARAARPDDSASFSPDSIENGGSLLQVGAILSLLQVLPGLKSGPFQLDEKILEYLGKAASIYEERIVIQKARLLDKMQAEASRARIDRDGDQGPDDSMTSDEKRDGHIPIVPLTPTEGAGGNDVAVIEDDQAMETGQIDVQGDEAVSAAVQFDDIITAVAGEDDSLDGVDRAALRLAHGDLNDDDEEDDEDDDDEDSSDSDSTNSDGDNESDAMRFGSQNDEDLPHSPLNAQNDDSSSSDISSHQNRSSRIADTTGDSDEDDEEVGVEDDDMLRQALALSLADHSSAVANDAEDGESESEDDDGADDLPLPPEVEEPGDLHSLISMFGAADEKVDLPLPRLPEPPSHYPYGSTESDHDVDTLQKDSPDSSECLDPSSLSCFGSLPASLTTIYLFRHLLSILVSEMEQPSDEQERSTSSGDVATLSGGMGCALFLDPAPLSREMDGKKKAEAKPSRPLSVQLLSSTFLLLAEQREAAISGLRTAALAEQRAAQIGIEENAAEHEDGTPLSDEEDDPALVLAMNYVEDTSRAAHPSLTESLEAKGLTRKAAAAAQDAALHLKSLRTKTDAWKERVKLLSYCTLLALRSLRCYQQSCVSKWLSDKQETTPLSFSPVLSPGVSSRFAAALCALDSPPTTVEALEEGDIEEILLPLALYKESLRTWSECVSLLHPTVDARHEVFMTLVKSCFDVGEQDLSEIVCLEDAVLSRTSEADVAVHRLETLSRRFCVSDMLDGFVPSPYRFNPDGGRQEDGDGFDDKHSRTFGSSLIGRLSGVCATSKGLAMPHLQQFYHALCHRQNLMGILWDGLYTCSPLESDESGTAVMSSSPTSAESIRVRQNPSLGLQFDSTKCSDSIAILANHSDGTSLNGASAHQRASKVWGTVLSSTFFNPKTGIHQWAVRLDRCERGHVFVGVTTSQASTRTYVGGDKYGWGVIGTQALWHDRRKIRGDYGATFRTGSVIIVTLDSDAGTLSFSTWRDATSTTKSYSLEAMVSAVSSPRRGAATPSGAIDDWGVAFEGLPLDARLYPAVGLYQRDDRVTLLPVESGGRGRSADGGAEAEGFDGGSGYFPMPATSLDSLSLTEATIVRKRNSLLSWDTIRYATHALKRIVNASDIEDTKGDMQTIIPTLAASLCLLPAGIPILSQRCAVTLLPLLTKCILFLKDQLESSSDVFPSSLVPGKWLIRATGSTAGAGSTEYEEYVVDVEAVSDQSGTGIQGNGVGTTGKSKNGLVNIVGTSVGSTVHFVEDWRDEGDCATNLADEASSSCVVSARMNLKGTKFEGTYQNVQYGTTGHIAGVLKERSKSDIDSPSAIVVCQSLLALAHGHLATMIATDAAGDQTSTAEKPNDAPLGEWMKRMDDLRAIVSKSPFVVGLVDEDGSQLNEAVAVLRDDYLQNSVPIGVDLFESVLHIEESIGCRSSGSLAYVKKKRSEMLSACGRGSLHVMCQSEHETALLSTVATLLHLSCAEEGLSKDDDVLRIIWKCSIQILEDELRKTMASASSGGLRERCRLHCMHLIQLTKFLLGTEVDATGQEKVERAIGFVKNFFNHVTNNDDLEFIKAEYRAATRRGILRVAAMRQTCELFNGRPGATIECAVVALPRLLGRAWGKGPRLVSDDFVLGGHFLSDLGGCGSLLRDSLKSLVKGILVSVGEVFDSATDLVASRTMDSCLLGVLAAFCITLQSEHVVEIVLDSGVVFKLPKLLSIYRDSLANGQTASLSDKALVVSEEIRRTARRDIRRAVLCSCMAVANIITFQVSQNTIAGDTTGIDLCVELLLSELREFLPSFKRGLQATSNAYSNQLADNDYDRWLSINFPARRSSRGSERGQKGRIGMSGLVYLLERGTIGPASVGKAGSSAKAGGRDDEGTTSHSLNVLFSLGAPFQHHMSQCLNLLCVIVKSPAAVNSLLLRENWRSVLLGIIGLENAAERDQPDGEGSSPLLPARFRARILRLLRNVVPKLEVDRELARGLFMLAGSKTSSIDDDGHDVTREVVSLLRILHSPSNLDWRRTLEEVITGISESAEVGSVGLVGVLTFLSGCPSVLRRGNYVLLKPQAAAMLSSDGAVSPGSKAHASGNSSGSGLNSGIIPHHLVGNGTEGIIAGLCRIDSSAGLVSSIDLKTGSCEVVLVERGCGKDDETRPSKGHRVGLTVRALRTPHADVAQAEEVPLCIDVTFPWTNLLLHVLPAVLNESTFDSVAEESQVQALHVRVLLLRSVIVLLSNREILSRFQERENTPIILRQILSLASPKSQQEGCVCSSSEDSLAALPTREGRYFHLREMQKEVLFRRDLCSMSKSEVWLERLQSWKSSSKTGEDEVEDDEDAGSAPHSRRSSHRSSPSLLASSSSGRVNSNQSSSSREVLGGPRTTSQSSAGSNSTDDEDESEAAATAAAHLREAAIAQMAELGLPRSWSELALRRTGGTNIEAAVHFCLERGGDMERLLAEERERERMMQRQSVGTSSRRRGNRDSASSNHLLRQLLEMGFPSRWCAEALAATRNNVDEALTWILTNGERLSAEDEGMEEDEDEDDDEIEEENEEDEDSGEDAEEDETEPNQGDGAARGASQEDSTSTLAAVAEQPPAESVASSRDHATKSNEQELEGQTQPVEPVQWSGSVTPLRFISGRSIINPKTLSISGLPTGGFSSVGTKGVMLTSGRWYYEAVLETAGCLQIGWADGSFSGHCHADRGDGCGDGPSSWAYDGWRRYRWHSSATEWGCRWKEGDVVGCLVDMDDGIVSFTLNGKGQEIGMGVAYSGQGFRPCGGVYACVSFNRRERLRLVLGGKGNAPFHYGPPEGYRGVGEAVLDAVDEYRRLLSHERILDRASELADDSDTSNENRFLCDFSDGEHGHELFAWQHRYYGSDASVHLGSGRNLKQSGASHKSTSTSHVGASSLACVSRTLEKKFSEHKAGDIDESEFDREVKSKILSGLAAVNEMIEKCLHEEAESLCVLYCRKAILSFVVTNGDSFDLRQFAPQGTSLEVASSFWSVLDECVSLRSAGWVGEAGAMAIAAEALGLGISSNEQQSKGHSMESHGSSMMHNGIEYPALAIPGLSQLLNTVGITSPATCQSTVYTLAACAEASIGTDGGVGPLVFLQRGLQSAVSKSRDLQELLLAVVRRSVRLLAVVDFMGDDSAGSDNEDDDVDDSGGKSGQQAGNEARPNQSDARLTCFLTGLLLSAVGQSTNRQYLMESLLQGWSIGLLSASAPWRMVSALSSAAILNLCPESLTGAIKALPTVANYFSRLLSTVTRRMWAERAALPVCSRYAQAMIELLSSVRTAVELCQGSPAPLLGSEISVDAATPIPIKRSIEANSSEAEGNGESWEWDEGWVSSDSGWEVWTGTLEVKVADWKAPSRSAVRTLMDGGEGPPMLREGCTVIRGLDWDPTHGDEDGKSAYEAEKAAREKEKRSLEEQAHADPADSREQPNPAAEGQTDSAELPEAAQGKGTSKKKRRRKIPNPKLPLGKVVSIEPWDGVPAMARKVRWQLTGKEGIYRYGGGGGRFDISHVEVNEKSTRVRKRHPLPESAEQCAARHGFGSGRKYSVLLRLNRYGERREVDGKGCWFRDAILELPDFGAGIRAECIVYPDGTVSLSEKELLYGSKDSGWEARFGEPSFQAGAAIVLTPPGATSAQDRADVDSKSSFLSLFQEVLGSSSYTARTLRNRSGGGHVQITNELRLLRGRRPKETSELCELLRSPTRAPPPITFDRDFHAGSLALSRDGRTVTCVTPDGRGTAFASIGFAKGVHYWEVKLEQADIGSVFIGVAEKPTGSVSSGATFGHDSPPRLNRWLGCGFVNFRATYTAGAERVYGAHCHNEDTVGVLLDCDAGRVSFFYDGLKYGEHILNDLGCAFENISPFGFNADGCGSGGAGQGAPSGIEGGRGGRYPARGVVRPKALWPVIGLKNPGDRVTLSMKWMTSYGVDGVSHLRNAMAVDEIMSSFGSSASYDGKGHVETRRVKLPVWFVEEAFAEYKRWHTRRWYRSVTRGSGPYSLASTGFDVELDTSIPVCAAACAGLGLRMVLLPGDRVSIKRSAGRHLELAEEAVVLGAHQGRLFYRIVSQKSEGGSLMEGGGRAWFWDESEVVDNALQLIGKGKGLGIELPLIDRFKCGGGLKIIYEGGAVVRSDLEIFDRSENMGTIPFNTVLRATDVVERRVNSCGVIRYRVRHEAVGEGWISSRIRGGKEEAIIEPVHDSKAIETKSKMETPEEAASVWFRKFQEMSKGENSPAEEQKLQVKSLAEFKELLSSLEDGGATLETDSQLVALVSAVSDFTEDGDAVDCDFAHLADAIEFAVISLNGESSPPTGKNVGANQAALAVLSDYQGTIPSSHALLARIAVLRAFNRRARLALPWLSLRPCQEGTSIFGGLHGYGASVERAGRNRLMQMKPSWVQVSSIASRVRSCRGLLFSSVKKTFLDSVINATTTPTPLSHDEYELPREIRTVRINRLKARRAMAGEDARAKRKYSVFAQLQNETRTWGGAALRRGFVAKGHGGQKRAFKVKLVGEGVNDYSGPYREVYTDAMNEIVQSTDGYGGALGVLDPTPNNATQVGDDRELYMFSIGERGLDVSPLMQADVTEEERRIWLSFCSLTMPRDETSREVEESLVFLGRLVGTACRHGIPVDLPLPMGIVWNAIVEESHDSKFSLQEIDLLQNRQVDFAKMEVPNIMLWQHRMLNSFVDGLSNVLPVEILTLFTGQELRAALCGNTDVDVDLLRRVVEYEGYNEGDATIKFFWNVLREMSSDDRKKFLQFVWARSRLPNKESEFDAPFKIQKELSKESPDMALPSASTCFFTLSLPEYSTQDILRDKLHFAVNNVCTMESDYVTNDAEVGEGWRGLE